MVRFTPRQLYPREEAHSTDGIGSWVCPNAYLNALSTAESLISAGNRTTISRSFSPELSIIKLVLGLYCPGCEDIIIIIIISNLSNDRSKASSKAIPPHSAI